MAGSSNNASQTSYDRLVERVDRFKPRNHTAPVFKEIGQYLLEVNSVNGSHNNASIEKGSSAMLPAQYTTVTLDNLHRDGYVLVLLRHVSSFFDADELNALV